MNSFMPGISTYGEMKNTDVRTVSIETLVDIKAVNVNTSLPQSERLQDYLLQIRNPYCFKHDDTIVKISFADTEATLEDRIESYLRSL